MLHWDQESDQQMKIDCPICPVCQDHGFVSDELGRVRPCLNCYPHEIEPVRTIRYEVSYIHNGPIGFDSDLFSIDKVWLENGEVTCAERVFRIPSPKWLQNLVFRKSV